MGDRSVERFPEIYTAIDGGLAESDELERELRILASWKWNGRFRGDAGASEAHSAGCQRAGGHRGVCGFVSRSCGADRVADRFSQTTGKNHGDRP